MNSSEERRLLTCDESVGTARGTSWREFAPRPIPAGGRLRLASTLKGSACEPFQS